MKMLSLPPSLILSSILVAVSLTVPATDGQACSYGGPGLWVMAWPNSDVPLLPTNSHIWFAVTDFSNGIDTELIGPEGPVGIEIRVRRDRGQRVTAWIAVAPIEPLAPNTTYTLQNRYGGEDEPTDVFEITTDSGPMASPAPKISNLRYYAHTNKPEFLDSCSEYGSDSAYFVFVDEPLVPEPFFYHLTLTYPEGQRGTERVPTEYHYASVTWGGPQSEHGLMVGHSHEATAMPCIKLSIDNVLGETVASETVCEPAACFDGPTMQELWRPETWEGVAACSNGADDEPVQKAGCTITSPTLPTKAPSPLWLMALLAGITLMRKRQ